MSATQNVGFNLLFLVHLVFHLDLSDVSNMKV